ncbi:MAG: threonine synthase [Phycisphaerae bacterium]
MFQRCILPACGATYSADEILFSCQRCGSLLDVAYDWSACGAPTSLKHFDDRRGAMGWTGQDRLNRSGVWRFRELLPIAPSDALVTVGEGQTLLQRADGLAQQVGVKPGHLFLQYEGFNPSGSFKDNGMAAAFTLARRLGCRRVACASTGNTSASLALFASQTALPDGSAMEAVVFVGDEKIAHGKLAQALDFGAKTLQVAGDFDTCMTLVQQSAASLGLYLMNSVNPFRLEGQKAIMYRVLEGLNWEVPDWIIVPGGNLGNTSAFGKAFAELLALGLIDRLPRLAVINASGANTLYELFHHRGLRFNEGDPDLEEIERYYRELDGQDYRASTVASAIEIGRPVNLIKALRSLEMLDGIVRQADDPAILDAKALVGRFGYGCEPASGASVAGLSILLSEQIIAPSDRVVCILTGHGLKDPNATVGYHGGDQPTTHANRPIPVAANIEAITDALSDSG